MIGENEADIKTNRKIVCGSLLFLTVIESSYITVVKHNILLCTFQSNLK